MHRLSFYQNEALLYQFFLYECLLIYQKLQKGIDEHLIYQLIGYDKHSWEEQSGHLHKLHHYYHLMITHFNDSKDPLAKNLKGAIDRSMKVARACLECCAKKTQPNVPTENNEEKIEEACSKLKNEMKKFTKILFEKLPNYREYEQVLYFLLRHHEQFDHMHGKSFTAKKISSLFQGGLTEASAYIQERYIRKGFNHLLPTINEKITLLQSYDA